MLARDAWSLDSQLRELSDTRSLARAAVFGGSQCIILSHVASNEVFMHY